MVLRMGKTLEARTMPGPGGRWGREGGETGHPPGHGHGIGQQPPCSRSFPLTVNIPIRPWRPWRVGSWGWWGSWTKCK